MKPTRNGQQTGNEMGNAPKRGQETGNRKAPKSTLINPQQLTGLKPGESIADPAPRGTGKFTAWKMASGNVMFYYRYARPDGSRDRLTVGSYDPTGRSGLTLAEARARAAELARRYAAGDRDLRGAIDAEEAAKLAAVAEASAAAEKRKAHESATLGALLEAYAAQLERNGKRSAKHVARSLTLHVQTAKPKLWKRPAAEITTDDLLDILTPLTSPEPTKTEPNPAPKLREAAKLRAYLRAAFAAAVKARHDARALPALRALKLTTNPARDLSTIEGSNNARERALSVAELRAYWKRIGDLAAPWGPLLRFHLLTGAQRLEQLARATTADLDNDSKTLTLWDSKGRRKEPRRHVLPLLPEAETALAEMIHATPRKDAEPIAARVGPFAFTASNGEAGASYHGCAAAVREVAADMLKAGELDEGKGPFTIGDLRRSVETRLAALGVSLDVRAQLQSHGLGGVQARHYDRHDYAAEKRAALEKLRGLLIGKPASVTSIKGRRKAK